jgi:hypothetical protein
MDLFEFPLLHLDVEVVPDIVQLFVHVGDPPLFFLLFFQLKLIIVGLGLAIHLFVGFILTLNNGIGHLGHLLLDPVLSVLPLLGSLPVLLLQKLVIVIQHLVIPSFLLEFLDFGLFLL